MLTQSKKKTLKELDNLVDEYVTVLRVWKQATKEVLRVEFNEEDTEALLNQIEREAYWIHLNNKMEKLL